MKKIKRFLQSLAIPFQALWWAIRYKADDPLNDGDEWVFENYGNKNGKKY